MTQQQLEEKIEELLSQKRMIIGNEQHIDLWKLFALELAAYVREETLMEVNLAFESFTLNDWSGECEVYEEIERLRKDICKD